MDFLYTSGKAGRYNLSSMPCIYGAEDQATAGAESERYRKGRTVSLTTYWIKVTGDLLDLGDAKVLKALQFTPEELYAPWRGLSTQGPTKTQLLGQAVAESGRFCGIRFPADAAKQRGFSGYNVVIFREGVKAPWSVVVSNDQGEEVSRWPELQTFFQF